jgi:hypothetical protein
MSSFIKPFYAISGVNSEQKFNVLEIISKTEKVSEKLNFMKASKTLRISSELMQLIAEDIIRLSHCESFCSLLLKLFRLLRLDGLVT